MLINLKSQVDKIDSNLLKKLIDGRNTNRFKNNNELLEIPESPQLKTQLGDMKTKPSSNNVDQQKLFRSKTILPAWSFKQETLLQKAKLESHGIITIQRYYRASVKRAQQKIQARIKMEEDKSKITNYLEEVESILEAKAQRVINSSIDVSCRP